MDGSTECILLEASIEALKKNDKSIFELAYRDYKSTNSSIFDEWRKVNLNNIYRKVKQENPSDTQTQLNNKQNQNINEIEDDLDDIYRG